MGNRTFTQFHVTHAQDIGLTISKSDLRNIVSSSKHLDNDKQSMLYDVLTKYEFILDGTLGTWKMKPVDIELHTGSKPCHAKPYPVPRAH